MNQKSSTLDLPSHGTPLPHSFFARSPLEVAPDLLGRVIVSTSDGLVTSGRIVETEAYLGAGDPGSHASTIGMTRRNAVMYGEPGTVYVYFTYGNHHMTNLVCEAPGTAGAVLLRALEPLEGLDVMGERRGGRTGRELCNGPGKLSQALGIDLNDNGTLLGNGRLEVYSGSQHQRDNVVTTGRIGLSKGHDLPYRFFLAEDAHVSRGRLGPTPKRSRALR